MYVLIYVDDILVKGNSTSQVQELLSSLAVEFSIKDLEPLHFFLGVKATAHRNGLLLTQSRYINDLLQRAGMSDYKPVLTPIGTSSKPSQSGGAAFANPSHYRLIVGALQYITLTRPNVTFVVNKACQTMHAPTDDDWSLVKRILQYLKGTSKSGLYFERSSSLTLQAFSNAD
ncbi:uncharacterized mitochondrial protein AtMg00810-like [Telopea speciosissima]|uniref:uncharacterized mitochondrial protein AtMg00810-like n=1 Tax=Telopea speciosissima TaxID=54955 RepID=UPI001CC649B9|nr:uncharacterized mitochondrial protein AtMg00810-like [Telopea speciosissima]